MVLQGSDVAENIVFLVQDPLTEYTVNIINRGQFYPVLNAYIIKGQAYFRVVNGHQRETKVYPLRKKINIQLSMINNISENTGGRRSIKRNGNNTKNTCSSTPPVKRIKK